MNSYTNSTRHNAILTVDVQSSDDLTQSLHLGEPGDLKVFTTLSTSLGINDIEVPAGKQLRTANNTVIQFLTVRSIGA